MALLKMAGAVMHGRAAAREVLLAFRSLLDVALEKVEPGSSAIKVDTEADDRFPISNNPSSQRESHRPRKESISIDE